MGQDCPPAEGPAVKQACVTARPSFLQGMTRHMVRQVGTLAFTRSDIDEKTECERSGRNSKNSAGSATQAFSQIL